MPAMAELYCTSSARVTYRYKDPRGWAEFKQQFADGSATGHAMTMRGVQGARVPFFERTEELKKIAEPMLVVIGDEDEFDARPRRAPQAARAALRRARAAEDAATPSTSRSRRPSTRRCRISCTPSRTTAGRRAASYTLIPPSNRRSERSRGASLAGAVVEKVLHSACGLRSDDGLLRQLLDLDVLRPHGLQQVHVDVLV